MEDAVEMVLSLGSNVVGHRRNNVSEAQEWLMDFLENVRVSSIYETPPLGHMGNNYVNCVVRGLFHGSVEELDKLCKSYEEEHGRDEVARKNKLVPVDIDIVVADGKILRKKDFHSQFFQIGYKEIQ